MMWGRIQSKNFLLLLLTILIAHCGGTTAGIPSSTEGGVTGGHIYYDYSNGATGDGKATGTDGGDDTGEADDGGTTGEGSYSAPSDDPTSIPITIGKCEKSTDTTASALTKASTKSSGTRMAALGKTNSSAVQITLRGAPSTFDKGEDEKEAIVMNVSTGEIVTTPINRNGSFEAVTMKANSKEDWYAVFTLDDDFEVDGNAVVFKANGKFQQQQDDDPETCTISTDEEKAFLADMVLENTPDSFRLQ